MGTEKSTSIQGFRCIETRFSDKCTAGHTLFYKEHAVRNSHPSKPVGKTLFVLNVPPYYTERSIKELFKAAGSVESVCFEEKPSATKEISNMNSFFFQNHIKGFKVAYVVYKNVVSLKAAMKLEWKTSIMSTEEKPIKTGLEKWISQYESSFIDPKALQTEVDTFMSEFDTSKEREEEEAKLKEGQPDDEGWITVTKHSKHAARTETMEKKVMDKEKQKQKDKKLINFYSFQMRETKMEHLTQLRRKFEDDKKRIATMRAARKFKPY
ncbi:ribosomal RNA-processing protein 7 homolog A-like [Daphnia pulex]|uniref:ribosomal RNA-processing protein 7 homolog A-like n=1 Tax=Daphnia pulex TaxID=6669 RepID=UPI001EE0874D|nr:ribosomal RNA-processing protein 7 homolog A-like [Daphnia pulex]